jgi:PadR family transcriptional regulator PadR
MNKAQTQLLKSWCETYKKSQLTLWILLAVEDSPQDMTTIRMTIEEMTDFSLEIGIMSLYRALRRLHAQGLLDLSLIVEDDRPAFKLYQLSKTGRVLLRKFLQINQAQLLPNEYITSTMLRLISRRPNKQTPR